MRSLLCPLAVVLAIATAPALAQVDLHAAAEAGDLTAQLTLAERFENGDGVVQNFARAAQWYDRAAEAGSRDAANRLGRLHHAGLGVPRDIPRAIALLERAAESGDPGHLYDLALVIETTQTDEPALIRAAELYRRAAEAGHLDAAVSLGVLLQNGKGVKQDFAEAAALYQGAADAGHARALNNLGLLYVRGDGVPKNYDRAAELFKAAADTGLPEALTNLGVLYENGFGVPQSDDLAALFYRRGGQGGADPQDADHLVYDVRLAPPPSDEAGLKVLEKAARAGDPVAEFQVAYLVLENDQRDPRRDVRAALMMRRAAEAGHAPAMANLALLYFRGFGVPQDYVLGQMWLVLAGTSGFDGTAGLSAHWSAKMTAAQINEAQARAETKWDMWQKGGQ
ncbi:SEL1-like repeat protein [Antarctobacter heliothermus]|uniref:TPR repeat n=1 Tax=Antarctobacter heliothermus TaxID=74033 RepID=A0A239HDC3_9RHOB|nr:tetratricopeptide repeat protein [Antarctobacter heliothermus]SNS79282.1 TPR repeat [Antarctobacter heliothermus]